MLFLLYINNLLQALSNCHTYLYADHTSTLYEFKELTEIENVLSKQFMYANVCDWFVDNYQFILVKIKLNVFFSVGKTLSELNIAYNNDRVKQYCHQFQ